MRKEISANLFRGGVPKVKNDNPIEYTGKVLDKRNTLTGPDDSGKGEYPKRPKGRVSIKEDK